MSSPHATCALSAESFSRPVSFMQNGERVTVTPVGERSADVRICSPDATGFGCDLARTMFDFGLVVERGDFSTDGKWSFLMFKARAVSCCA